MKAGFAVGIMILLSLNGTSISTDPIKENKAVPTKDFGMRCIPGDYFTLNEGQIPSMEVIFHSRGAYFTTDGVLFRVFDDIKEDQRIPMNHLEIPTMPKMHVFKVDFPGANMVVPEGMEEMDFKSNFFFGNDTSKWATGVPNYEKIIYGDLYDGIDLVYRVLPEGIKYEFVVHPGADASRIQMRYTGADIYTDGKTIQINTSVGTLIDSGLSVYQPEGRDIRPVAARISVDGRTASFEVDYDHQRTLVIDPLIYSATFGSGGHDFPISIDLDSSNNAVVTGYTYGNDFPTTPGAYNPSFTGEGQGGCDIFVIKFNENGSSLIYSTLIGSVGYEFGEHITLDSSDNAYVTGYTTKSDFPVTPGAYDTIHNGGWSDAYLLKLNQNGSKLLYSTFIGGSESETGSSIALMSSMSVYVAGGTSSSDFPTTPGAYSTTNAGEEDLFLIKLNLSSSELEYSTLIGGNDHEWPSGMDRDDSDNIFLAGWTNSTNLPVTAGAYDRTYNGGKDCFMLKFDPSTSKLVYSSYAGGSNDDFPYGPALDSLGNLYLTGNSNSSDFPVTTNAYDKIYNGGSWDIFVLKMGSDGSKLQYSTYIGGNDADSGLSIELDSTDNAIVTGITFSPDFPIGPHPYDRNYHGQGDVIVLKINTLTSFLAYSTFIGGNEYDLGSSLALDSFGKIYVAGDTTSRDFPTTPDSYKPNNTNSRDLLVLLKLGTLLPGAPENLSATTGNAFVQLNWTPPSDGSSISKYIVYRGMDSSELSFLSEVGGSLHYLDSSVTNGVLCSYAVSAVDVYGEGSLSDVISVIPGAPPMRPTRLSAITGKGFVDLTWVPPIDNGGFPITGYKLFKGSTEPNISYYTTLDNITSFKDTAVETGSLYFYRASALNFKGESPASDSLLVAVGTPPTAPRNLKARPGIGYVQLDWDAPDDYGGFASVNYRIYKGEGTGDLSLLEEWSDRSYNDTDISNGRNYYYCVSATNLKGEGPGNGPVLVQPGGPPAAPNLTAIVNNGKISLAWTPGNDSGFEIAGYRLYRGTRQGESQLLGTTSLVSYEDDSVMVGKMYFYEVSAVNSRGEGPRSNEVSAVIPSVPSEPLNLEAIAGNGYVRLSWLPPDVQGSFEITKYIIYRSVESTSPERYKEIAGSPYNDTGVENGISYSYQISAVNPLGEGKRSASVQARPLGPPEKISNLTVEDGNGYILLEWSPPLKDGGSPIKGYRLYKGITSSNLSILTTINEDNYNDTSVSNGIQYYYRICAFSDIGEGTPCEMNATPGAPPSAPANLRIVGKGQEVVLTWDPPVDSGGFSIDEYRIYRGASKERMALIDTVYDATCTDLTAEEGKIYYYRVCAVNIRGEGQSSDVKEISLSKPGPSESFLLILSGVVLLAVCVTLVAIALYYRKKKRK